MRKRNLRLIAQLFLCFLAVTLPLQVGASRSAGIGSSDVLYDSGIVPPQAQGPYLQLSVTPAAVRPGELFTLTIAYHDIGLVYTTITTNPPNMVVFDPPLSMPCKYDSHPNGCTSITMRAVAKGAVSIDASATGEIFDSSCQCFRMSGASDNGPASVVIKDSSWLMYLPLSLNR